MLHLVVILLFGQVFSVLQLGTLFRPQKLASVVTFESNSRVDLSERAYSAILNLDDAGLDVPFIDGASILLVSKQGKMTAPKTNKVIKVHHGDIVIIHHGHGFQKSRYRSVTAENLQKLIEDDKSAHVFGVVIQDPLAPGMEAVPLNSDYGFSDYDVHNVDETHDVAPFRSSCLISTKAGAFRSWVAIHAKGLEAFVEEGGIGVLIRNGLVVERFVSTKKSIPFQSGDVVLIMLSQRQDTPILKKRKHLLLKQAISLIHKGNHLLLGERFPTVISFAATIVGDIPNYLENATIIGKGTVDGRIFRLQNTCGSTWWFKGNTIQGILGQADVLHIKNEENKSIVEELAAKIGEMKIGDALHFRTEDFKLSHLQPRDIIVFVHGVEGIEKICGSAIKRALSGCKTSADLQNALDRLQFHPSTTVMAAFVSDKIPPSKMKMTSFIVNEAADESISATWTKLDNEINVSLPKGASARASASIMFTDRNKVSIKQTGGAVALIINEDGLKYGSTVAFGNTLRKLKLEDEKSTFDHGDLEVERGDIVMVLLPSSAGEYKLTPLDIGTNAKYYHDDFDAFDDFFSEFLPEGTVVAVAARIERTE
ncbi:hypothetical protein PSACC_01162 [Paramicrosporidium saccamoebae]|uniref:PPM-type phosphatase domain-containing protein n=1 Tax=Paramicrosporidium saccamoebae TaxID=1246581 RepID=A0A2H9TMP4_9FUNG|nr:hypothetical protein PSACC_01162 [Paramicrosporidium saccamoebae]